MTTLSIFLQAAAMSSSQSSPYGLYILIILMIMAILAVKDPSNINSTNPISNNQTNKVVNVNLIGGIIGMFSSSPQNRLNSAIKKENANGWKVIQVIPSQNGNLFLALVRFILLIVTLFLYTTANGYYIIMEKQDPRKNGNQVKDIQNRVIESCEKVPEEKAPDEDALNEEPMNRNKDYLPK